MPRLTRRWTVVASIVSAAALPLAAGACNDDPASAVRLSVAGKRGEALARANTCAACHSANGDELTGPTWKGLYGAKITLKDGKRVTVDDAYIERSIREPNAQRRDDATGQMPTFDEDRITDAEIADIISYIKDLSSDSIAK